MRRLALIGSIVALSFAAPAAAAPSGFLEETYTQAELTPATGAVWAPDGSGRLFVLRKSGAIQIVQTRDGRPRTQADGKTLELSTFATEPSVYTNSEGGLLGLAFDPNYIVNHYVYVFVTVSASQQQIVRYTDIGGGLDAPGTGAQRSVILSNLPTVGSNHVGGGLAVGADGKLYFSIGDLGNGTGVNQDLTSLASKVGRANLDGTPASDNPFYDGVGPNNEYIWARGLRNPFGLLRQPETGKLWTCVAGTTYEQVFILERAANAGYNTYENNQPAGYLAPTIAYRTNGIDERNVAQAQRTAGILTIHTNAEHPFRVGQAVTLAGLTNAAFNGDLYVRSAPTATSFTAAQAGPDDSLGAGGTARTKALGGAITRGTFYDSTAFPSEYRGNFFFGDYNSGGLVRTVLSSANQVERVDEWSNGFSSIVQVTTGDDGALYGLSYASGVLHRVSYIATAPALVVSNAHPYVPEGGRAAFTVALAAAPAANLTVTVARAAGESDIGIASGASLTFTPTDWQTPRAVVLEAANDADTSVEVTHFDVSASGLPTERVTATSIEGNGPELVLSAETLSVPEGEEASFSVAWSARLSTTTTVTVARILGDSDVSVVAPATLTFNSANWATPQTVTIAIAEDADGLAGRAQLSIASPQRARILEVVEIDDEAPPDEPDAGLADSGTDELDATTPGEDPSDSGTDAEMPGAGEPDAGESGDLDAGEPDTDDPDTDNPDTDEPPDASVDPDGDSAGKSEGGCQVSAEGGSGPLWLALSLLVTYRRRRRSAR